MGEICLSLAPILRCQSLTRLKAGILLLPPGLEVIFAIVLLWIKRGSDKKDVLIASEVFIYFLLAMLDLLSHTISTIGTSLDSFRSLDIVIGAASFIPIFLYMFSLYLLTATDLVPSLPVRFQNIAKYVLLAFIPFVIILNELSSFVGITYRSFGSIGLAVGFTDASAKTFLGSLTLVLLTAFQASNFCIAFYRLVHAFSHQRTLETTRTTEKAMEAHVFRGLGWIVAGMKLGAIETIIGFVQDGFAIVFARRILRLLSRACLIVGMIKGVDTVEDFQLYSPDASRSKRKSMLRAMIQNPRFSTFRHVGGHDFEKQAAADESRQSVIRLGDPSWMRRDFTTGSIDNGELERASPALLKTRKTSSLTFMLAARPSESIKRNTRSDRNSVYSVASSRRSSWPYAESPAPMQDEYDDEDEEEDGEIVIPGTPPAPRLPRAVRQRVTVHIRQDRLPVLELRRFSNLEFLDLIQDPFRDPHYRAHSLPIDFESNEKVPVGQVGHVSASFTRLPAYAGVPPPLPTPSAGNPARGSVAKLKSRLSSYLSYDRLWGATRRQTMSTSGPPDTATSFGNRLSAASYDSRSSVISLVEEPLPSAMPFHAIGSPSETITSFESPGSRAAARFANMSRKERGLSSSTTASEVRALTIQFPGIPARPHAPARHSMLSHEVPQSEFFADAEEPMPEPASVTQQPEPEPEVARVPSVKRKPAPLMTEGLTDERIQHVKIEQVIDEETAVRSLPTPTSAPLLDRPRAQMADVPATPSPPSEPDSFGDTGEAEVVRSASLVKRSIEQGRLMRVKSVGHAPMHSVSVARPSPIARDSVQVELGRILRGDQMEIEISDAVMEEPEAIDTVRYSVSGNAM